MQFLFTFSILAQIKMLVFFKGNCVNVKLLREIMRAHALLTQALQSLSFKLRDDTIPALECLTKMRAWKSSIWLNFNSANRNKAMLTGKDFVGLNNPANGGNKNAPFCKV